MPDNHGARSMARLGMVQPLEVLAGDPLMNPSELRIGRQQWQGHIGGREQQGIHRRIEAQWAFESILVRLKIGRRRKPQFERQRTYIAIANLSAEGAYRHKVVLETLPRNGVLTPEQLKNQPVSLTIVCNGEGSRVAEDMDIADSPLEDAEQIWGRHHSVCYNIEAPRFHST